MASSFSVCRTFADNDKPGCKKRGLVTVINAGINNRALIRQEKMDTTINTPKKRSGAKPEKINAAKPTITEKALKTMPLPEVFNVLEMAVPVSRHFAYSSLYRHKKWMV